MKSIPLTSHDYRENEITHMKVPTSEWQMLKSWMPHMHELSALQNVDLLKFTFLSTSPIRTSPIHISRWQLKFSSCLESIKTFLNHGPS